MSDIDVFLGIPCTGKMSEGLVDWLFWITHNAPYPISFQTFHGRPADDTRNAIVEHVLSSDRKYTHIWMVDDDVNPNRQAARMPLHDKSIVSSILLTWQSGGILPLVMKQDKDGLRQDGRAIKLLNNKDQLISVDATGTGCFVAKVDVYQNMRTMKGFDGWFRFRYNKNGRLKRGEDFAFFLKCREMGYKVYIDSEVVSGHDVNVNLLEVNSLVSRYEKKITELKLQLEGKNENTKNLFEQKERTTANQFQLS